MLAAYYITDPDHGILLNKILPSVPRRARPKDCDCQWQPYLGHTIVQWSVIPSWVSSVLMNLTLDLPVIASDCSCSTA